MTENIHIAILGPVSAGKSTLLNALFSNTFSDMKRKKTTMLPQIYQTTLDKKNITNIETILEMNRKSNEEVLKLREENKYTQEQFKELKYYVAPIYDFIELPDEKATYSILDMPGLNCGGGVNMYFNYIESTSKQIDIYILVFDINSGLNTTDEINILIMINAEIEKNKHGYVHILINKCDDVVYDNDGFKFTDSELQELYDRCKETAKKYLKDVRGHFTISPLCASELYVFRGIKNNIDTIDEKHLDKIIMNECGKKELTKLKTIVNKRKFILGLIKEKQSTLYNDWMKDTGYNLFKSNIKKIMSKYKLIVRYHITNELIAINNNITDFDATTNKIDIINRRLNNLKKIDSTYIVTSDITDLITCITTKLNTYIKNGIDSYSASTVELVDNYINKIGLFFSKVKGLFTNNPFETTQTELQTKRYLLLNSELVKQFNQEIFKELYCSKQINIEQFTESIANQLKIGNEIPCIKLFNKPNIARNTINLLNTISQITNNDPQYIDITINQFIAIDNHCESDTGNVLPDLINRCTTMTDSPEYRQDMIHLIKTVAKITNNNIESIYNILNCYFQEQSAPTMSMGCVATGNSEGINRCGSEFTLKHSPLVIFDEVDLSHNSQRIDYNIYWIERNQHLITSASNEVSYLYYKLQKNLKSSSKTTRVLTYIQYVNLNNEMINIFNNVCNIFNPVQINNGILLDEDVDEIEDREDEKEKFEDAKSVDDESDEYNDIDDSTTVYIKARKNTSKRVVKTMSADL
jgi:hypothetical protein